MNSAIIVAAGKGTRMGPNMDKLLLEIAGRPLVIHTWQRMDSHPSIHEVVLVVRSGMESFYLELASKYVWTKPFRLVLGGAERQDSVWNGLQALDAASKVVAIQDGARPCTHPEIIEDTIRAAREMGAAVAASKVADTLKEANLDGSIARTVDRSKLWAVQTPQTFQVEVIKKALLRVKEQGLAVTDDTAACELIGQPVRLVEGKHPNPKATTVGDLPYLTWLLSTFASGQ